MTRGKTMVWSKSNKKKNLTEQINLTHQYNTAVQLPELHKCPELMEFTKLQHQQERQVYDDYQ